MSYFLAFLGFAALIILHEAGHFAAAKAVGMRVERFSLFFGPMLVKRKWGETEYGIGPIPLGGYVKITGMNPNEDIPPEVVGRAYYNQPVWKRVVTILAGPAVNIVIAFIIFVAIFSSLGQAVYTKSGQPVISRTIAGVAPPASQYLKPGDQIVAVDGRSGLTVPQITNEIEKHKCAGAQTEGCVAATPVKLTVRRGGRLETFTISPRYSTNEKRVLVGVSFNQATAPVGLGAAASGSARYLWYVTHTTVSTIVHIFQPKDRKQLNGIVGGYTVTQQSVAAGPRQAFEVLGLISLSLGVINLFPFLPLDGGHVFWALAEKVRGRRIPFSVMERAGVVGFALIILLFVIGLSNDISTLTGPGFHVPR
ncbi:MAG TPA: M50 family metallopeptidase [Solirubrobacteraceae bacterium]|jgi:regulator of sigma E protease|nr:M50 family metallopeptidase [Solirubrobacteraceae bacterium]